MEPKRWALINIFNPFLTHTHTHTCTQLIQKIYGEYNVTPEENYDISLQFDYDNLPANKGKTLLVNISYIPPCVCVCVCVYVCVCVCIYVCMCLEALN